MQFSRYNLGAQMFIPVVRYSLLRFLVCFLFLCACVCVDLFVYATGESTLILLSWGELRDSTCPHNSLETYKPSGKECFWEKAIFLVLTTFLKSPKYDLRCFESRFAIVVLPHRNPFSRLAAKWVDNICFYLSYRASLHPRRLVNSKRSYAPLFQNLRKWVRFTYNEHIFKWVVTLTLGISQIAYCAHLLMVWPIINTMKQNYLYISVGDTAYWNEKVVIYSKRLDM